jgi:hypothetical protein
VALGRPGFSRRTRRSSTQRSRAWSWRSAELIRSRLENDPDDFLRVCRRPAIEWIDREKGAGNHRGATNGLHVSRVARRTRRPGGCHLQAHAVRVRFDVRHQAGAGVGGSYSSPSWGMQSDTATVSEVAVKDGEAGAATLVLLGIAIRGVTRSLRLTPLRQLVARGFEVHDFGPVDVRRVRGGSQRAP